MKSLYNFKNNKEMISYFNEKYPNRNHYMGKLGMYFTFKSKKLFNEAVKNGYDTRWYSGIGVIGKCIYCGETHYLGILHKKDYKRLLNGYVCPKCTEKLL